MWSDYDGHFDMESRNPNNPYRVRMAQMRREAYMDRWNQKFLLGARARPSEHAR